MYENNKKDFMWGVLAGGALATLVSLLFTTKKGKQIQKQVGDLYEDIETNVKDAFTSSKDKIVEAADQVGEKIAAKTKSDKPAHGHGHAHSKDKE